MSEQNFVSYGDAETLMAGVKSAIDGAGGGGSVAKTIISSYSTISGSVGTALIQIRDALNSINDVDILHNLMIEIIPSSTKYYSNAILRFAKKTTGYYIFSSGTWYDKNFVIRMPISGNDATMFQFIDGSEGTSNMQNQALSSLYIKSIVCYYNKVENSVVPSGETETVVASYSDTTGTFSAALTSLFTQLKNADATTKAMISKLKMRVTTVSDTTIMQVDQFKEGKTAAAYIAFRAILNTNAYYFLMQNTPMATWSNTDVRYSSLSSMSVSSIEIFYN